MLTIDQRYVDVYFPANPRYSRGYLGMGSKGGFRAYGDHFAAVPQEKWEDTSNMLRSNKASLDYFVSTIKDQAQEGACVGNGSAYAVEIVLRKMFGVSIPISAMSIYKPIARSAQSGAIVTDAIELLADVGCLPEDTPANKLIYPVTFVPRGFSTPFPAGYKEAAGKIKATTWYRISGFTDLVSAILSGIPVVVGREGHCICYVAIIFERGKIYALYVNSWTEEWGQAAGVLPGGFGVDSEKLMRESAQDCYGLAEVTYQYNVAA